MKKRITLEYVLIKGLTDRKTDIEHLTQFCSGLNVFVNLIPWNSSSQLDFETPTQDQVQWFCKQLERKGINTDVRREKGQKINGACGQLADSLEQR